MTALLELHDQMKDEYNQTAKFFGEDPNMTSTEEFFGIFSTFVEQFEVNIWTIAYALFALIIYRRRAKWIRRNIITPRDISSRDG